MQIQQLTFEQAVEYKEKLIPLFERYYAKGKDIVDANQLYQTLLKRLEEKMVCFLVWGEENLEGFLICDKTTNQHNGRPEGFIWSVLNPKETFKAEVLAKLDEWATSMGIEALVLMAEKPMAFNKLMKPYGYKLKLGFFEKPVEKKGE